MSQSVNMGDKVLAGASVAGAITLSHVQSLFTSDAVINASTKVFTVTSPLIDAYTIPVVSVVAQGADVAVYTVGYGAIVPTAETLNSQGEAAVITPGTLKFSITGTGVGSVAPVIGVNFL